MRRRSSLSTILWISCSGLLLASCGDFQDPASSSQGIPVSHPSGAMTPQQVTGGTGNQSISGAPGEVVDPASQPMNSGTAPASMEPTGTEPQGGAPAMESAPGPSSLPSQSETGGSTTGEGTAGLLWLSGGAPPPGSVPPENRPQKKLVTFSWDPSLIDNVDGYRAYVTPLSTLARVVLDIGQATRFSIDLPIGERYEVIVTAYNAAGESPPASPIQFDLF